MSRFTIVGAGGVGTVVGVLLGSKGHDVTFVTRLPEEADAVQERGGRVFGLCERQAAIRAVAGKHEVGGDEALILAVKANQTHAALDSIVGLPGAVMSIQNGVDKELPLVSRFGSDRVVPCVVQVTGTLVEPGLAKCSAIDASAVSRPVGGSLSCVVDLARDFEAAGMPTQIVDDAGSVEWTKAAQWLGTSLMTAATGLSLDSMLNDFGLASAAVSIARECDAVARSAGYHVTSFPGLYASRLIELDHAAAVGVLREMGISMAQTTMRGYRSSMELDLSRGNPLELEETAGAVLRHASASGIPTPVLSTAYSIVRARSADRLM